MLMELMDMLPTSHLDQALALTPSLRVLTPSLRELFLTLDTTMARGLLMPSLRLMLLILAMGIPMLMELMAMLPTSHLDQALALTPSLRVLTPSLRELFPTLDTTMARGLLMPNLRLMLLILAMDIPMPSELTAMLLMFHLDQALAWTPSHRVLTPSLRDMFLTMALVMLVITMAR